MTAQKELVNAERRLAKLLRAKRPDTAQETRAATSRLREAADRVRHLRAAAALPRMGPDTAGAFAGRHAMEQEQRARQEQRKQREPTRKAFGILRTFADPELNGAVLDASRLTVEEGEEMLTLVEARRDGSLTDRKRKRLYLLAGKAAGDPGLFERTRKAREEQERARDEEARARLEALPVRVFSGRGGSYLPSLISDWLWDSRDGSLDVVDLGVLAVCLLSFERGESPFYRSRIEDETIVLHPGQQVWQLRPGMADPLLTASRISESLRYLSDCGWIELGVRTIERGERARRQLEEATPASVT